YFNSEQDMHQFYSKEALGSYVAADGSLEKALRAEKPHNLFEAEAFFSALNGDARIWEERNAGLVFTPGNSRTFSEAMMTFSEALLVRNVGFLHPDAVSQRAASKLSRQQANWQRLRADAKVFSLLEFTHHWITANKAYGHFLQDKGIYERAEEFNPDAVLIKPFNGKNIGSVTEYAAYLRRHEAGGDQFAADMEVLPVSVADDDYVSSLSKREKHNFATTLKRIIKTPDQQAQKPVTADERYVGTLKSDERQHLHDAMQLYLRLNQDDIRGGLDEAMRSGFPGTDYQSHLQKLKDLSQPMNLELRNAWNAVEISRMQLALSMEKERTLPANDARRLAMLTEDTPSGDDFKAPLTVGNVHVPGCVMFTLRDRKMKGRRNDFITTQYVYTPDAIHGRHIFTLADFNTLMRCSSPAREMVSARVKLADKKLIDHAFRQATSGKATAGYELVPGYDLFIEMINRQIADADEMTISHWEVIRDAAMTGIGMMVLPACIASGPAAVISCAGLTTMTLIDDIQKAVALWKRGEREWALVTGLLGTLDVTDVTRGIKILARGAGLARAVSHMPDVLKGMPRRIKESLRVAGHPEVGRGGSGIVITAGRKIVKKIYHTEYQGSSLDSPQGYGDREVATKAKLNVKGMNLFYGDSGASAKIEENSDSKKVVVYMQKVDGTPLSSLRAQGEMIQLKLDIEESGGLILDELIDKLSSKKIFYEDFNPGNLLYDLRTKKMNLIDFDSAIYSKTELDAGTVAAMKLRLTGVINYALHQRKVEKLDLKEVLTEPQ
ncbi:hypothetical protein ACOZB2_22680, partial [Pantoea endophytica]